MSGQVVMGAMLSPAKYAARHGRPFRQVQDLVRGGYIRGAVQGSNGYWRIPADAPVLDAPQEGWQGGSVVTAAARDRGPLADVARPAAPVHGAGALPGVLVPLDVIAAAIGTTVGGVRRLADAGHLVVGPFGPHGALRVYLGPTR
jgi:hypothetical protein